MLLLFLKLKLLTVAGFCHFLLLVKLAYPFYFRIFGVYLGLSLMVLMVFPLEVVELIKNL